jgi:uncharacterized protein DUF3854
MHRGPDDNSTSRNPASVDRAAALFRQLLEEDWPLAPEHREDLTKSGLSDATIRRHRMFSVWRRKLKALLRFALPGFDSGMVIPFPDPAGGFLDHIRVKVFPTTLRDREGHAVKYLQPKGSPARLFVPLATMAEALDGETPLWLVEGEKKSLAVAQLGLPAIGFCGIHAWHTAGSRELIPDFEHVTLANRIVELVPDGDVQTNQHVRRGAEGFALALARRGAKPRLVVLPDRLQ